MVYPQIADPQNPVEVYCASMVSIDKKTATLSKLFFFNEKKVIVN